MDNITKAGIRAGVICALIICAGIMLVILGWLYVPREQLSWFLLLYSAINLFAFILAGILSGYFAASYVAGVKESFMPGIVAGGMTAAIPAALSCLLIILGVLGGREQYMWAMIGLGMLFYSVIKIFISALLSAAYIIIARRSTITIKFE
jgi:hypothetical protein